MVSLIHFWVTGYVSCGPATYLSFAELVVFLTHCASIGYAKSCKEGFAPAVRPILLLLDGHSCHYCPDTVRLTVNEQVVSFTLPPNTTRPLNKGCFGSLKVAWSTGNAFCGSNYKLLCFSTFFLSLNCAFVLEGKA